MMLMNEKNNNMLNGRLDLIFQKKSEQILIYSSS